MFILTPAHSRPAEELFCFWVPEELWESLPSCLHFRFLKPSTHVQIKNALSKFKLDKFGCLSRLLTKYKIWIIFVSSPLHGALTCSVADQSREFQCIDGISAVDCLARGGCFESQVTRYRRPTHPPPAPTKIWSIRWRFHLRIRIHIRG
jgi:hypothetical protein